MISKDEGEYDIGGRTWNKMKFDGISCFYLRK